MLRNWPGFIELFVFIAFALGWGVLEYAASRLDKLQNRAEDDTDPGDTPRF